MPANNNIPSKQRALVLQGGGALGAYEAGVLNVLCKRLDGNKVKENGPLFDIIAGTSIGAMNAAILVSNVVNRKKSWEEGVRELENFWTDDKKGLSSTPDFGKWWWDGKRNQNIFNASCEAARRYYSVKEYLRHGTPNVCLPLTPEPDLKFADPDNTWFANDSKLLQNTIERYSKDSSNKKLRIATSWKKGEPRLLVISVDVAAGKTVVFDSYHKEVHDSNPVYDGDGITIDHVMASGTIPIFYKLREIGGRKFCDGGILRNTPFRELLQSHQDYWTTVAEDKDEIPDLDVYIVNVHPSTRDIIPTDLDGVKDRINDITLGDRDSQYDQTIAELVTDYRELIYKLKGLAKNHFSDKDERDTFENAFGNILTEEVRSKTSAGKPRKYRDLLKGRFKLDQVVRIEPKDYSHSISGKGADFTSQTIKAIIEKGKEDAFRLLGLDN
jgi:NTE family protein